MRKAWHKHLCENLGRNYANRTSFFDGNREINYKRKEFDQYEYKLEMFWFGNTISLFVLQILVFLFSMQAFIEQQCNNIVDKYVVILANYPRSEVAGVPLEYCRTPTILCVVN